MSGLFDIEPQKLQVPIPSHLLEKDPLHYTIPETRMGCQKWVIYNEDYTQISWHSKQLFSNNNFLSMKNFLITALQTIVDVFVLIL